jgi:hypothetical protein
MIGVFLLLPHDNNKKKFISLNSGILSPPYKNPIFLACPYVGRG